MVNPTYSCKHKSPDTITSLQEELKKYPYKDTGDYYPPTRIDPIKHDSNHMEIIDTVTKPDIFNDFENEDYTKRSTEDLIKDISNFWKIKDQE